MSLVQLEAGTPRNRAYALADTLKDVKPPNTELALTSAQLLHAVAPERVLYVPQLQL